jgi:signal transduction histidine kinase/DNA-binding response OmpR family regulator
MDSLHQSVEETATQTPARSACGRILVVDDEPRMTDSVKALLAADGHDVVTANSGSEALAKLDKNAFDVVLADLRMPDVDGLEVLRAARQIAPDRPVVMMTAYASLDSAVAAINDGAYDYLIKPIDLTEMRLTIRRAVEKHHLDRVRDHLVDELREKNRALGRRVAELNALHEVGAALSTTGQRDDLLKAILNLATGVIGSKYGSIMLVDPGGDTLSVAASSGLPTETGITAPISMTDSISGYVAKSGEPMIIEDVENDPRFGRRNRPQFETSSLICAPLKTPNAVVGVINLSDKRDGSTFSVEDLRLLVTLAAQAAMAIEDAKNYRQISRQLDEVIALNELANRLSQVERIDEMVTTVFEALQQLAPSDRVQWWEFNSDPDCIILRDSSQGAPQSPLEVPLTRPEFADSEFTSQGILRALTESQRSKARHSLFCVHVRSAEQPLGIFALVRDHRAVFSDHEKHLARIVGSQAERIFERQRTLLNASRLVTMGKMISEISHDLRKPLTNIRGSLQVLGVRLGDSDECSQILKDTEQEIVRLGTLVKELVDFSNPTRYRTERRDLAPALQRAASLVERAAEKNKVKLTAKVPKQLPPIYCDENQIIEAILNILMNAIEAMSEGGTLDITAQVKTHESDKRDTLIITIADSGPGMSPSELARIFERYYTTKDSGTGLGLPIVQRIINSYQGTVTADSEPGEGTTFRVELPVR